MRRLAWLLLCAVLGGGCLERELVSLNPCLVSGVARRIEANSIDKVDLLFVVDNSKSMQQEQDSLKKEFPKLIRTLTSGERSDGTKFPAVKNLHLGVVSTDMGLAGIPNPYGCDAQNGGDDGLLQHAGNGPGCAASYPPFLTFELGQSNPDTVASDFACIAALGTGGCGFEQQLEAGLKALWPKQYVDANGDVIVDNPIKFLSTKPEGKLGHGDTPATQGGNGGFLRNDARGGLSLIAIVIVSDEEDCSSIDTSHFTTDRRTPIGQQPTNLRCFLNKGNLFEIERYVQGFKALRPGQEQLVVFAAIVGVPTDLVDAAQQARFNALLTNDDREAYYDAMLNDPRMQERPNSVQGEQQNLIPSCTGESPSDRDADAYPPVRIVQVARGFGANGVVQSICQKDFGPAMDAIIRAISDRLGDVCLPKPLVRTADGTVPCNVVWELPPASEASGDTPTACTGPGTFLEPVDPGRDPVNERGGQNCKVRQLAVDRSRAVPEGQGWYYDDFAPELERQCFGRPHRVSFTASAKPGNGVIVSLECVNETQHLPSTDLRRMTGQPEIGTACGELTDENGNAIASGDDCMVRFKDGSEDRSMFCHPELNVCVRACQGNSDCPAAWACDTRGDIVAKAGGKAFCVNPTCGSD